MLHFDMRVQGREQSRHDTCQHFRRFIWKTDIQDRTYDRAGIVRHAAIETSLADFPNEQACEFIHHMLAALVCVPSSLEAIQGAPTTKSRSPFMPTCESSGGHKLIHRSGSTPTSNICSNSGSTTALSSCGAP